MFKDTEGSRNHRLTLSEETMTLEAMETLARMELQR